MVFANELKPWPLKLESGKGVKDYTITNTMTLAALVESIYPIANDEVKTARIDKMQKVKLTHIGQLNGINVYDLIYPLQSSYYHYLKIILLERETNRYVPVYYKFIDD